MFCLSQLMQDIFNKQHSIGSHAIPRRSGYGVASTPALTNGPCSVSTHNMSSCMSILFLEELGRFLKESGLFPKTAGGVATFHMIWTTFTYWKKLEPQEYELKEGESTWLLKWKGQELWQFKAYRFSLEDSTTRNPKHIDRKTLLGTVFFRHIFCWSSGLYQKGRNSKPFPLSNSTS